mgnify:CR=1 FL=1
MLFSEIWKGVFSVPDYNAMLIDLLNEKIRRLEQGENEQRKEINRLKLEIRELKKELTANEKE